MKGNGLKLHTPKAYNSNMDFGRIMAFFELRNSYIIQALVFNCPENSEACCPIDSSYHITAIIIYL
jgi:hypothetical protein